LGEASWVLFEGARYPYVLLVTIYLFGPYFVNGVVGDPVRGQLIWAAISSYGALATAIAAPFLGAIADRGGRRKPWILASVVLMAAAAFLLWHATPRESAPAILLTGVCVVIANFGFDCSYIFISAMLASITPETRIGRLSGLGLALGNAAGILLMVVMLVAFVLPGTGESSWLPGQPLFGIDQSAHEPERLAGPVSGLWLLVLSAPLFLFTPDVKGSGRSVRAAISSGIASVFATIRSLRRYKNVAHYLAARTIFNDGLTAVLVFSGIYAAGTFHWGPKEMLLYGLEVTAFAAAGGLFAGVLDRRLGAKGAVMASVGGTALFFGLSLTVAPDRIFWFLAPSSLALPARWPIPVFATTPELLFILIMDGVAVFLVAGFAAARTMLARIAPLEKMTEFFGFLSLSGSSTTFLANSAVALVTAYTGSQRGGIAVILVFLVAGLAWMTIVHDERAHA
jgi:UMF1 family MFS transporter